MSRKRPRSLSAEDRKIWSAVAKTVTAARPQKPKEENAHTPDRHPPKPKQKQSFEVSDFRIGETATTSLPGSQLAPSVSERLAHAPVRMDHGTHKKMLRGKMKPEARIDLHGMTLAQAHPVLTRFILGAHEDGLRLVLVITGKGKDRDEPGPMPVPRGVLRHKVPQWLSLPPLAQAVMQVTPAHISHGGEGAYYVYLRRSR